MEEVWLPGEPDPVILPRTSEALYLLQRVRDEAHRFAITYHRQKRSSSMLVSLLDDVPGLGDARRKALMKKFGSLKRLRAATVEEIMTVPGIGRRTAEAVVDAVGTAIVGGDGSVSGASRPDGYTFARDGCIAGRLTRATPPFDVGSRSPPSGLIAWLSRVLPSRFGGARLERRPRAWKFERDVIPEADDPPLTVAAALFAVELSHW